MPRTWPSWSVTPPRALLRLDAARLAALIAQASRGHQGTERARQWRDAARASVDLYRGHPAVDFTGLAYAEIATEIRLLKVLQTELIAALDARPGVAAAWTIQQARNILMNLRERAGGLTFLSKTGMPSTPPRATPSSPRLACRSSRRLPRRCARTLDRQRPG